MTVSPLANMKYDIPALDRWQPRDADIVGVLGHHNAGVDSFGQATAPGREVSANYWISNSGIIIPNVDEENRAFTSGMAGYPAGAQADHRFITVEISNSPEGVRNGTWEISDAALEAFARLIADVHRRYNLGTVQRGTARGVAVHRDFVPTECPGPYLMRKLPDVIARAEALRTGTIAGSGSAAPELKSKEWYEMLKPFNGASQRKKTQTVRGGGAKAYVTFRDTWDEKWSDRTVARGAGHIVGLGVNIGLKGKPGDRVTLELVKETGENKSRSTIAGPVRATVDEFGGVGVQLNWTGLLASNEMIRVLAQVQNGKTLEVSQFYWNGETA